MATSPGGVNPGQLVADGYAAAWLPSALSRQGDLAAAVPPAELAAGR
jgi:hypothetical protein